MVVEMTILIFSEKSVNKFNISGFVRRESFKINILFKLTNHFYKIDHRINEGHKLFYSGIFITKQIFVV